jgi:Glycine rich protein
VSKVFVNAFGSEGEGFASVGGLGGWVQASLKVTGGQILYILVGGAGHNSGFNGGGRNQGRYLAAGGGASDIRTTLGDLASRLIVAGGGGGGSIDGTRGGNGGAVKTCLLPIDDR